MNNQVQKICLLLLVSGTLFADRHVATIIMPHSVSVDAGRELAGWQDLVNVVTPRNGFYNSIAITPEVTLSFKPDRIAQLFFGDDIISCRNTLTVSGSQSPDRADRYWLADYFGLPTDYKSKVSFSPQMSNALIDFDWYLGLNKLLTGLYFRIHAPLVYTRWDLRMCESFITTGSNAYDPGYFNATGATRDELSTNFLSFISGTQAPEIPGIEFHPLCNAKMSCHSLRMTRLSEIECALGWNILMNDRYHLGINARIALPTGNRPTGEFLFEPIVGNGHHWAAGGGLSTHIQLWHNEETEEQAALYCDINITHLFKTYQCRSFDLCRNGDNSRYMLAQRMGTPIALGLRGSVDGQLIEPTSQYQNELTTVANLTTLPVYVSASVQADIALMVNYVKGKNSWGIGYGYWGRSCEKVTLAGIKTPFEICYWALKGDAMAYGFEESAGSTPIPLSATESKATINSGTNFIKTGAVEPGQIAYGMTNPAIDNPAPSFSDSSNSGTFIADSSVPGGSNQIRTSIEPVLLTGKDININSARTNGRANKMFTHFTHIMGSRPTKPFLSIGAEMEFGPAASCTNKSKVKKVVCSNTALSFWGVWIKGGVAF